MDGFKRACFAPCTIPVKTPPSHATIGIASEANFNECQTMGPTHSLSTWNGLPTVSIPTPFHTQRRIIILPYDVWRTCSLSPSLRAMRKTCWYNRTDRPLALGLVPPVHPRQKAHCGVCQWLLFSPGFMTTSLMVLMLMLMKPSSRYTDEEEEEECAHADIGPRPCCARP